jgi:hypothetical protein
MTRAPQWDWSETDCAHAIAPIHTDAVVVGAVPLSPGIERAREAIHYFF